MAIAMTDEQRAVQAAIRQWAATADPRSAVRRRAAIAFPEPGAADSQSAESPPPGPDGWQALAGIGVFGIAVAEALGGAGGAVADLAAALEAAAGVLAPGPVLPTALATLLLRDQDTAPPRALLAEVVGGRTAVGVAVPAGGSDLPAGRPAPDGGMTVDGVAATVLGGAEAGHLVLAAAVDGEDRWFVLPADHPGVVRADHVPVDPSRSLTEVRLRSAEVPVTALLPGLSTQTVADLLGTLAAAEAAGVAEWSLRTATEYATTREQFGRPIGSFQAIKHLCADMLGRSETAAAVAWDAARAVDEAPAEQPLAAAVAVAVALDAAVDNAKDCIQILGGIGFTWEHDAHLYLRRALVLRQLAGAVAARRRTATLALGGLRRRLTIRLSDVDESRRSEVRAAVAEIAALDPGEQRKALADNGYLAPHWARPYGLDASPATQVLIDQELRRAGVTRPDLVIGGWAAPTILRHGTDAQRERFVAPTLTGEITWCQLFSEPGAGSDLAALRTRADRAPGGWRITGQKVWTSLAREADWAICLARTDPDVPQHKGISYFLVDMTTPGITVRPLREITGDAVFNEVFLDEVFVPDACVVGAVDGGWRLVRTTLANERVAMGGKSSLGDNVERFLSLAADGPAGQADEPELERLGAQVAEGMAVSLLDLRATLRQLDGAEPGAESSVRKLVGVAHRQAVAEAAVELLGAGGAVADETSASILHEFLLSRCLSIAGGTTQILRNVVAERLLGLPRG